MSQKRRVEANQFRSVIHFSYRDLVKIPEASSVLCLWNLFNTDSPLEVVIGRLGVPRILLELMIFSFLPCIAEKWRTAKACPSNSISLAKEMPVTAAKTCRVGTLYRTGYSTVLALITWPIPQFFTAIR